MSTKMEQPFYHDDAFLSGYGHSETSLQDFSSKLLKHNLSLNLASEPSRALKSHLRPGGVGEDYLVGNPDSGLLKLASPELERLIIQSSNGVITTTPTPNQYFCARNITDEQEGFADGFVKALEELHKINHIPPNVSLSNSGLTCSSAAASNTFVGSIQADLPPVYTNLTSSYNPSHSYPTANIAYLPQQYPPQPIPISHPRLQNLKEEPQTVPDVQSRGETPPMSPIDMENQERIKAERKRLRNRVAASKCRKRKLERISRLEDKVKNLKSENNGLASTASVLREQVTQLKQKVMSHISSGCQIVLSPKLQSF